MLNKKPLLKGTIILTIAGFISRLLGFVHRMVLTRLYSDADIGLYQLISPVLAISFSLCAAGIQTSISRHVASKEALGDHYGSHKILVVGLFFSTVLSLFCLFVMYFFADFIAAVLLNEAECAPLIRIIAFSVPLGSIHACINGYYYGIKRTVMPAVTQLIEQIFRILPLLILFVVYDVTRNSVPLYFAVIGLVIGEGVSMISSLFCYSRLSKGNKKGSSLLSQRGVSLLSNPSVSAVALTMPKNTFAQVSGIILTMAIPLSASRLIVNALAGMEAVSLPVALVQFGCTNEEALSLYGILTGMTLPLLFFPNAITNSVSVMLLPIVSESQAENDYGKIRTTVNRCIRYCLLLGVACTLVFYLGGDFLGNLLFHNQTSANYLRTLSFLCPIMYISSTLTGIIHGLGKTTSTLIISVSGLFIRLLFIHYLVPVFGMNGYLYGMLVSQALTAISLLYVYSHILKKSI